MKTAIIRYRNATLLKSSREIPNHIITNQILESSALLQHYCACNRGIPIKIVEICHPRCPLHVAQHSLRKSKNPQKYNGPIGKYRCKRLCTLVLGYLCKSFSTSRIALQFPIQWRRNVCIRVTLKGSHCQPFNSWFKMRFAIQLHPANYIDWDENLCMRENSEWHDLI